MLDWWPAGFYDGFAGECRRLENVVSSFGECRRDNELWHTFLLFPSTLFPYSFLHSLAAVPEVVVLLVLRFSSLGSQE